MKPNKVFLIIASVFLAFGILLGGIYFYISKTLTPENVRTLITKSLQTNFPHASVVVGAVEFGFGTSIDFRIKEIKVFGKTDLFQLSDARLRIPVWAILKGGGIVELEVNAPKFNLLQMANKSSNWSLAMANDHEDEVAADMASLPAFLISSRLNIKMKDTILTYRLADNNKGELQISKLLVKELGLENPAAFEIDTFFQFEQESLGVVTGKILLIGEADLHRFLSEGKLSVLSVATVSKINSEKLLPIKIPDFRSEIRTELFKDGNIKSNTKTTFKNAEVSLQLVKNSKSIKIEQLNFTSPLQDLVEVLGNAPVGLNPGKSTVALSGNVTVENDSLIPELAFTLSPGATFSLNPSVTTSFDISGKLSNRDLTLGLNNQLLQGRLITSLQYKLPDNFEIKPEQMRPLDISSKGLGLIIKKTVLDSFAVTSKPAESDHDNESAKPKPFILPLNHRLEIRESRFEDLPLEIDHDLSISNSGDVRSKMLVKADKGQLNSNLNITIGEASSGKIVVQTARFPGRIANPFIEKTFGKLSGEIDADINIAFKQQKELLKYDGKFNVSMTGGRLEKVNLSSIIAPLKEKLAILSSKLDEAVAKINLEPDFKVLKAKGMVNNSSIRFKDFHFIAIKEKFDLQGKGVLALNDDDSSEIFATYKDIDGNISSVLKNEIGTEELPLRLIGKGTSLKPDMAYTLKNLSSVYAKKKGAKKIKDSLKKVIKEKDLKKVNKLLKGILQ
tara:strand:+ start:2714 stop:4912 length:2199 start_codon:yes stop_codon:yes gene_type:complete